MDKNFLQLKSMKIYRNFENWQNILFCYVSSNILHEMRGKASDLFKMAFALKKLNEYLLKSKKVKT